MTSAVWRNKTGNKIQKIKVQKETTDRKFKEIESDPTQHEAVPYKKEKFLIGDLFMDVI